MDVRPHMKIFENKIMVEGWLGKKNLVSSAKQKPITVVKKLYNVSVNL